MPEDDKPRGEPAVKAKAKLPNAQNIKRPDFTPHGIGGGSKGRGPRPSALTAAKAKKRQRVMIAGLVVVALAIGGGATWYLTRPGPKVEVTGQFNKEPKVKIPADLRPGKTLKVTEAIAGKGAKVANGDTTFVKFVFYKWPAKKVTGSPSADAGQGTDGQQAKDGKLGSTYSQPAGQQVSPLQVGKSGLKGLDKGLVGHPVGSRLVMEIPPADGFGKGNGAQLGVADDDSLLFVVDVLATYPKTAAASGKEIKLDDKDLPEVKAPAKPGEAPKVTIPKVDPPDKLKAETLIEGTGAALTKGQTAIVQYQGQIWKGGKVFDSSWQKGQAAAFPVGTGGTVPGFDKGLVGKKIGSRVLLVLPPSEGYGKEGNAQAGIKGTDTLVFVVDILGVQPS